MVIPANLPRQQDFSAGQLDERTRRGDDIPLFRAGARVARNFRISNSRALVMRPARKALFIEDGRCDEVRMESGITYYLCFGAGTLRIRDSDGLTVAARAGFPWTILNCRFASWAMTDLGDIVVCFTNMRPVVIRRLVDDNFVVTWTFTEFTFDLGPDKVPRVPLFRVAERGITMTPSDQELGSITIHWSADVLTGNHVGSIFTFANRRIRIDKHISARDAEATVLEKLYPLQMLTILGPADTSVAGGPGPGVAGYSVGEIVIGDESDNEGEIVKIDLALNRIWVQLLNTHTSYFWNQDQEPPKPGEWIVGPKERGRLKYEPQFGSPLPTLTWNEQMISDANGWPQSCTNDRNRLTFTDLPKTKEAILWSAIGAPYDFDIDGTPDGAMAELCSGKPRVYHVLGGADQYVFTDQGVYYIPISENAPLQTGSVKFRPVAKDASDRVRPLETTEGHVYLNAGRNKLLAIVPTGQTARPYMIRHLTDYHGELFAVPMALAASTGDKDYPERYLYVLNTNGTVCVGKYNTEKDWIGWVPWDGAGTVKWISSLDANVTFCTQYQFGSTEFPVVVETFDPLAWIDGAVRINDIPPALASGQDPEFEHYRTAGVPLGDMSENATREAAFDSTIQQTADKCAKKTAAEGWVGRFTTVGHTVSKVVLYPSSDLGFTDAANVTLQMYGSNTLPATPSDGVLMGTTTIADTTAPVTIIGTHPTTAYPYRWVRVAQTGGTYVLLSEVVFFTQGDKRESSRGATGPLWWMATGTVDIADRWRYLGERTVDANGNLVLLADDADKFAGTYVYAGEKWTSTFEPLFPHANSGQSVQQTHRKRKIRKAVLALKHIGGFEFCNRRISGWGQGDNESLLPAWREEVLAFRSLGRTVDPRRILTKDIPGPMDILEFSADTTV
jgi:hypothetical protein